MTQAAGGPLAGRRVLIVEDRYLIASEIAEDVRGLGAEVAGPCATVAQATELVAREEVDAALLDVNLDGELVFPLADLLAAKGVPIVFLTGYDSEILPPAWRSRPQVVKPITGRELRRTLTEATGRKA